MCDPMTIMAIVSGVGTAATLAKKPPKMPGPEGTDVDAKAETGADVLLGGSRPQDKTDPTIAAPTKTTKKGGSSISGAKSTGISIL